MKFLLSIFFPNPGKVEVARKQLAQTELELLAAQSSQEDWACRVKALEARAARLRSVVSAEKVGE